ncbi:MAG: peptidyl-prolyl cis-trans isomerase [Bacteroidota bacterium]|nr:peptidyl-prolyl cis-trans isomerase [Bacteroidota bacterium]
MKQLLPYILGLLLIVSCTSKKDQDGNREVIARANNAFLYKDNIQDIIPVGTSSKDSLERLIKYIDSWVREVLVIQKAEDNLTEEQKNVEKQLQDYRNSLITYTYEKELVKQKLDTTIGNQEIEEYYNNNRNNFELKDNIIKVVYVKVNKKAPGINKLQKWYKSDIPKDKELLAGYCHQFAENFYLDENSWLLFDDLLKEIPIQTYNKELFLQNNRFVEVTDSTNSYFLNIKGFKIRNSLSPLSFERENIKNIILNKRKLQLITKMKEDIYNDAANNKKIEIYINDKSKK